MDRKEDKGREEREGRGLPLGQRRGPIVSGVFLGKGGAERLCLGCLGSRLARVGMLLAVVLLLACQGQEGPLSSSRQAMKTQETTETRERSQRSSQEKKSQATEAHKEYLQALLLETLEGRYEESLEAHRRLANQQKTPRRLRALSLYHALRLAGMLGRHKESRSLRQKLLGEFARQADLVSRLRNQRAGWPSKRVILHLQGGSLGKALSLLGDLAQEKIVVPSEVAQRKVTLHLEGVRWWEALQTVVWSAGLQVKRTKKGFEIQAGQPFQYGESIDVTRDEIPGMVRLLQFTGRQSGLEMVVRRVALSFQEEGMGLYPLHLTCKGTPRALATFLGRMQLLPFPLQLRVYEREALQGGIVKARLFVGLLYVSAPTASSSSSSSASPSSSRAPVPPASSVSSRGRPPATVPAPRPASLPLHLPAQAIRQVMRAHKGGVRHCFDTHQKEMKGRRLRVVLRMVLHHKGAVKEARLEKKLSTMPALQRCLEGWGQKLHFPPFRQGTTVVRYPFVFTRPTPAVKGRLNKAAIQKVIRHHIKRIKYCYERALASTPSLQGKVKVFFQISPSGKVSQARIAHSTLHDQKVEECMLQQVRTWRFPAPEGGGIVNVNYPFTFRPR